MDRLRKIEKAIKEQASNLLKLEEYLRMSREREDKLKRGINVLEEMRRDLKTVGSFQKPNEKIKEALMAKLERER